MKKFLFLFPALVFLPLQAYGQETWRKIGDGINNSYYFVIDKIIFLQGFFIGQALSIGRIVLLIAVFSAALNYALTGSGLKENIIKILKATVFFFIVIAAYPRIIGGITAWTFNMALESIYPSVNSYFQGIVKSDNYDHFDYSQGGRTQIQYTINEIIKNDNSEVFGNLLAERSAAVGKNSAYRMEYTTVAPAAVFKMIFFLATDCFSYSDDTHKKFQVIPELKRVLVGLLCGFAVIFTGIFALLEYLVCFLEFMLVSTVGVILFPLSLWEGSKFMAEKFVGAVVGFFIKLLFCNIAIFLLIYGFISVFYFFSEAGFTGTVDQIIFILFTCLMFLYICKSAPALAQSLLSGTPSLSASGAISAVGGAVAAAGFAVHQAQKAGRITAGIGGNIAGAGAAAKSVKDAGGGLLSRMAAANISMVKSTGNSVRSSLSRNLLGIKNGNDPRSLQQRMQAGAQHGQDFAAKHHIGGIGKTTQPSEAPSVSSGSAGTSLSSPSVSAGTSSSSFPGSAGTSSSPPSGSAGTSSGTPS